MSIKSIIANILIKMGLLSSYEERKKKKEADDYAYLIANGIETKPGYVKIWGEVKPIIKKHPNSRIILGKGVDLVSDSRINPAGINHPVILSTLAEGAEIIIHDNVGISGASIVAASKIEIGTNTMLGVNTNIWDTDFHSIKAEERLNQTGASKAATKPITIQNNVWIGAGTTVLKGVTIGEKSVIGAMSLVTKDIPMSTVAAGTPAIVIKTIEQ